MINLNHNSKPFASHCRASYIPLDSSFFAERFFNATLGEVPIHFGVMVCLLVGSPHFIDVLLELLRVDDVIIHIELVAFPSPEISGMLRTKVHETGMWLDNV